MSTFPKLLESKGWLTTYRGIGLQVKNWWHDDPTGYFRKHAPTGNWNFYLTLPEKKCTDFAALWLPDIVEEVPGSGRKYIRHAYPLSPLSRIEMHGGITFYQKHGYTEGFRSVEVGCDYGHSFDGGRCYMIDDVLRDATRAIDSCYEGNLLLPEVDSGRLTAVGSRARAAP